jgi:hypothetical protein
MVFGCRRTFLSPVAGRSSIAIAKASRNHRDGDLRFLPDFASAISLSGLRHGYGVYVVGRRRTGDGGSIGRIDSWPIGYTRSDAAGHDDHFGNKLDNVRSGLSIRNISGEQIRRRHT